MSSRYYYNTTDRTALPDGGCYPQAIAESRPPLVLGLYPNPAFDKLYLHLRLSEASRAEVFDAGGRLVLQCPMRVGEEVHIISLQGLLAGSYVMRITDHRGKEVGHATFVRK